MQTVVYEPLCVVRVRTGSDAAEVQLQRREPSIVVGRPGDVTSEQAGPPPVVGLRSRGPDISRRDD
jgi:hypothetical protein